MNKTQTPIIAEKIHLIKLDVVQQKIDDLAFKKENEHQLKIGHKFMYNLDDELVKIELNFSFDDKEDNQLLFFQIDFHYKVDDLNDYYNLNETKEPVFYSLLIVTLLGISLSTARGVMFSRLQNIGVDNVIIPVIDPQKILTQKNSINKNS